MLEVGKLYRCSEYFLLIYPDKEAAAEADAAEVPVVVAAAARASDTAAYWSNRLDKPVNYCDPLTPILVLNTSDEYVEVLAGDQKGWIIYQGWLELKEIVNEAA